MSELKNGQYEIILCPNSNCVQKLRVPLVSGVLVVTCPRCGVKFEHKHYAERRKPVKPKIRWFYRKWVVIPLLIIITPLGIILLWMGGTFKTRTKIGLTIAFGLLFIGSYLGRQNIPEGWPPFDWRSSIEEEVYLTYAPRYAVEELKLILWSEPRSRLLVSPLTVNEVARRSKGSVALIKSFGKKGREIGQGSGFAISDNGLIATNYHVLAGARSLEVKFLNQQVISNALLVLADKDMDLAVIKVEGVKVKRLQLGDSDSLELGEKVVALGNPLGLEGTLTVGHISHIHRQLPDEPGFEYIQIDAAISWGSSGGPLLNLKGQVVGITTKGVAPWLGQNLNFAIPVERLKYLILTSVQP